MLLTFVLDELEANLDIFDGINFRLDGRTKKTTFLAGNNAQEGCFKEG